MTSATSWDGIRGTGFTFSKQQKSWTKYKKQYFHDYLSDNREQWSLNAVGPIIGPAQYLRENFQAAVQEEETMRRPVVFLHWGYGTGSWLNSFNWEQVEVMGRVVKGKLTERKLQKPVEGPGLSSLQLGTDQWGMWRNCLRPRKKENSQNWNVAQDQELTLARKSVCSKQPK